MEISIPKPKPTSRIQWNVMSGFCRNVAHLQPHTFFVKRRAFEIAKKSEILLRTKEPPLFHLFFFNSEK